MKKLLFFVCSIFLFNQIVFAQFDNFNFATIPEEVLENSAFNLSIELLDGEQVEQAVLFYRAFGTSEFLPLDMIIQGNRLLAEFNKEIVIPPSIECYIKIIN